MILNAQIADKLLGVSSPYLAADPGIFVAYQLSMHSMCRLAKRISWIEKDQVRSPAIFGTI